MSSVFCVLANVSDICGVGDLGPPGGESSAGSEGPSAMDGLRGPPLQSM